MRLPRSRLFPCLLAVYWLALVVGTHLPAERMPQQTHPADKVLHVVAYAGLAILLMAAFPKRFHGRGVTRVTLWTLAALALHGAIDEATQGLIPGRFPSVLDWIADCVGALLGVATYQTFVRYVMPGWSTLRKLDSA